MRHRGGGRATAYPFLSIEPRGGQPGGKIRVGLPFRADRGLARVDRPGGDATTPLAVLGDAAGARLSASPGRVDTRNPAWRDSRKQPAAEFSFGGRRAARPRADAAAKRTLHRSV